MDLKGRVAVVTGASRGIGRTIAETLAAKGCSVVLAARSGPELDSAGAAIRAAGGTAVAVVVDLAKQGAHRSVIDEAVAAFGTIDILVNNAAVLHTTPFLEVTEEEWDAVMSLNVKVPFLLSQAALRIMKAKRSGYIVNISSTAALQVPRHLTTYGTSKKALIGLSEALYETAKECGVKVSVIYPGMTDTEMLRSVGVAVPEELWMKTEDIAGCILFLLEQSDRVVVRDLVPWASRHDQI
jgi:NAD(P)-dependent dehydrogenase (short-subunit alcohol dehydrogenase family)